MAFDPDWGGPASIEFDKLTDWTDHANEGIRYYSGQATYTTAFTDIPAEGKRYWLQLNQITMVNSWQNRLIGDRGKPQEERFTKTNVTIRDDWKLRESGLLGPVEIRSE